MASKQSNNVAAIDWHHASRIYSNARHACELAGN